VGARSAEADRARKRRRGGDDDGAYHAFDLAERAVCTAIVGDGCDVALAVGRLDDDRLEHDDVVVVPLARHRVTQRVEDVLGQLAHVVADAV